MCQCVPGGALGASAGPAGMTWRREGSPAGRIGAPGWSWGELCVRPNIEGGSDFCGESAATWVTIALTRKVCRVSRERSRQAGITMKSGGLGFWGTVAASVLALLIGTFISWVLGFHHRVWLAVVAVAGSLGRALTFSVPVPVVVLVILAGILLYSLRFRLRYRPSQSAVAGSTEQPRTAQSPLLENEVLVIRLLAAVDGRWLLTSEIAGRARLSVLVTEQAIERLMNRQFVAYSRDLLHGTVFRLSSLGRDYAIDAGFTNNGPRGLVR